MAGEVSDFVVEDFMSDRKRIACQVYAVRVASAKLALKDANSLFAREHRDRTGS